ncbi:S8 family peptidase [Patescibacteria group bacterium]|nr:S8 family peptidase [Patescibacteria group bacterium]
MHKIIHSLKFCFILKGGGKMKKALFVAVIIAIALVGCGYDNEPDNVIASSKYASTSDGRYIVTFDGPVNEAAVGNNRGHVLKKLSLVNGLLVLLPDHAAVKRIQAMKGVKGVEVDAVVYATAPPGACSPWPECKDEPVPDPEPEPTPPQTMDWGVDRIDADLAWSVSKGTGVKVAVIDTGIDKDHPDLAGNLKGGVNFVSKNPKKPADPNTWDDDNGHGTHVAGIIAAIDNTEGVVGVAPEANLYAVKVLDKTGSGYVSDIISGLQWAVNNGMDVVNMSLGAQVDVQAFHDAVDAADAAGVLLFAAAGNDGDGDPLTNEVDYPAKYDSVVAVGATASDDSTPYWSSEGAEVEVSAPGANVLSTTNDGGYGVKNGTSMATPHVVGVAALMVSAGVTDVRGTLTATAEDLGPVGFDNSYGYGLVDAQVAVGL